MTPSRYRALSTDLLYHDTKAIVVCTSLSAADTPSCVHRFAVEGAGLDRTGEIGGCICWNQTVLSCLHRIPHTRFRHN